MMDRLKRFQWPGNVRQLENMIKQVVVREDENIIEDLIRNSQQPISQSTVLESEPVLSSKSHDNSDDSHSYSLKSFIGQKIAEEEKKLISEVLTKTNWNRRKAAEILEISYRSLLYKIKDYNLNIMK